MAMVCNDCGFVVANPKEWAAPSPNNPNGKGMCPKCKSRNIRSSGSPFAPSKHIPQPIKQQ